MDNQHNKITGYRDLSKQEIDTMNAIKALEAQFNGMIDALRSTSGADQRQVNIAATLGEQAFMHGVKAIAKPDRKATAFTAAGLAL